MNDVWSEKCIISPSLICLDHCNFANQIEILEQNGAKMLHVDILDGHFSPSMPLGLETVKQIRKITHLPFDAHVMATKQDYFLQELLEIGVEQLTFHAETAEHIDQTINFIRQSGARVGVALKPSTPISTIEYVLEKVDTVLLMLINPGYAGYSFEKQVSYSARKIRDLRNMICSRGLDVKIELDGRISAENIIEYGGELADIFVVGSTCIKQGALGESIRSLCELQNKVRRDISNG